MKLTAKLRLIWNNDEVIPGIDGFFTSIWIPVDLELMEKRNYRLENLREEEGLSESDWTTLETYYFSYGLGSVPARAHPMIGVYGLPDSVELRDTEWEEEE